ncbi:VOC family protein [Elizabethkingia anophelis]|uniref:VOC family protein n=1 Tax=Elizabethkingia anophelis TaxID=1117645 RepID=UPI00136EDF6C|nr:VOC family protein [Elizabethkingia anophelis]MYZ59118.1 VOC family protein [Elizabethkingia anophelis]
MRKLILSIPIALCVVFIACNNKSGFSTTISKDEKTINQKSVKMNSYISIFEIPATDISRAINFYKEILGVEIEKLDFPEMEMGLFSYQDQMVTGVIMKADGYKPSADGVTIYLNGGNNLQIILDKVERNGGKVIVPKTPHADGNGFFAIFLDTERNKLGLHATN